MPAEYILEFKHSELANNKKACASDIVSNSPFLLTPHLDLPLPHSPLPSFLLGILDLTNQDTVSPALHRNFYLFFFS